MIDTAYIKTAHKLLKENLGVRPGEKLSIITDAQMLETAEIFQIASAPLDSKTVLAVIPTARHRGQEPPEQTAELMKSSDVALLLTKFSISHTIARLRATEAGARMASMGNVTPDMFEGALSADYSKVARRAETISGYLFGGSEVRIKTASGTDLTLSIAGRKAPFPDTGFYIERGQWGNLPAGEAFIAPLEDSLNGLLIADSTRAPLGMAKEPVILHIDSGRIERIEGGPDAIALRSFFDGIGDPNALIIAELGIGTNDRARLTGKIIEDEKKLGTLHLGFGMNIDFGGKNESKTHNDFLVLNPTLEIDGKTLLENGVFQIELEVDQR